MQDALGLPIFHKSIMFYYFSGSSVKMGLPEKQQVKNTVPAHPLNINLLEWMVR